MDDMDSMSLVGEKTECISVRLSDSCKQFVKARALQAGMEHAGEYIRHLVELDMRRAEREYRLLSDALGVKVSPVSIAID